MIRTLQLIVVVIFFVVAGLSALSRRFPDVGWLSAFRHLFPELSKEQRKRLRRRGNRFAGIEMILYGLAVPVVYVAVTVMFFRDVTTEGIALAAAGSVLLIGTGVFVIWRNRD